MRRLTPDPGETTVERQLDSYRPWEESSEERPFVATNFAVTVDGRATIGGVSGPIGSSADTEMLARLRTRFEAVMIGAGTMRAERYGQIVADQEQRERHERLGLPHDPLLVIVSGRLDLPWEAPLFTEGAGQVLIVTSSEAEPPETATPLSVLRHDALIDLGSIMRHLREERGIRALLCEGGPHLHGQLWVAGLVDELFLTTAPKLSGDDAPRIVEGMSIPLAEELELAWLLERDGELFARYRRLAR